MGDLDSEAFLKVNGSLYIFVKIQTWFLYSTVYVRSIPIRNSKTIFPV